MRIAPVFSVLILSSCLLNACGGANGSTIDPPRPVPAQPLTITSGAPPNGSVQTGYGFSLSASGGTAPYTWSWSPSHGSSLPPGLSISAAGLISGTPTAAGTYNAEITVTDSETPTARASANYSILIVAAGQIVITSGAPPNGTVSQTYGGSHTITQYNCSLTFSGWPLDAAGGTVGYHWSWAPAPGSSLPPGLTISVASNTCGGSTRCCVTVSATAIAGAPTTAGTYHVIVTVADSASPPAQASANYTINIGSAAAAATVKVTTEVSSAQQFAHYVLIDLGTFGGTRSYVNIPDISYAPVLNRHSAVAGWVDTLISDPYSNSNFCFNFDCFVSKAFQWQNGTQTELKGLAEGLSSQANWISPNGLIAGISQNGAIDPLFPGFPESRAVLWKNGEITDLGTLPGGFESAALAVNNRGQVVGAAANDVSDPAAIFGLNFGWVTQTRAFLWQDGVMQDLGTLCGADGVCGTDAVATLINERGQIVGESYISATPSPKCDNPFLLLETHSFVWEHGTMKDLGSFGGTCTVASDLNNQGEVVGISTTAEDSQHAFLWRNGSLTDLHVFSTLGGDKSSAIALNNAGEAVGFASVAGDQFVHATLWKNNTMTDLGTVDGDACSAGFSINAAGQVVGISSAACDFSQVRAFLWEGGAIADLNTLIPRGSALYLTHPANINDRGEIAGLGIPVGCDNVDVCGHAFVLIPCDAKHPNLEGCDYTPVEAVTQLQFRPTQITQASASSPAASPPLEVMTRLRSSMVGRNRRYWAPTTVLNDAGELDAFNAASAITKIEPVPTNLTSFAFKRGLYDVVELSWTDHSTDADSYHIERCTGPTCINFSEIAVTGGSATHYIDSMWPMHLTFRYRVRAHSPSGYSGYSNISTQTTP